MMMVAFLMAGWAIQLDLRQRGLDEDYAADIVIAGVIGGLVGAKLVVRVFSPARATRCSGAAVSSGTRLLGATLGILINAGGGVFPGGSLPSLAPHHSRSATR